MISIIIPAKNEERTIGKTIRAAKSCFPDLDKEIIVIDGKSKDKTVEIAKKERVKVIVQRDSGKGNAMKLGFEHSSGEIVVFTDADIQNFGKKWIENIVKPILDDKADVVLGWCSSPYFKVATEAVYKPLIRLLFPEVEERISFEPLTGQRAFKRTVLSKIKFFPNFGVEAAMNIDLVNMRPVPRIEEIFLGKKLEVYKGSTFMTKEIIEAIISKAKEYDRFSRIKERNFIDVIKIFNKEMSKLKG